MATLHDIFLSNWVTEVALETAWATEILPTPNGAGEQRLGLVSKPYRILSVLWTPTTQAEVARVFMMLARIANESLYVPLYPDVTKVTASSSGTVINCDPSNKRFVAGSQLIIYKMIEGRPAEPEVATIDTVGASTVTLTGSLSQTFPEGSEVAPVILTEVVIRPNLLSMHTTKVAQVQVILQEVRGSSALPALVSAEDAAGFSTAPDQAGNGSYPILSLEPDWSDLSVGWRRDGSLESVGVGQVTTLTGTRPRFVLKAVWAELDRASIWSLLKLVDGRRGRLLPLWVLHPSQYWEVQAAGSTFLDVTAQGEFEDLEDFVTHIGIAQTDGTHLVRAVSSYADNGSTWRINLSSSISVTLSQIDRACPAFFVRLDSDALEEKWLTDQVMLSDLTFLEVINEEDIAVTNIDNYIPGA